MFCYVSAVYDKCVIDKFCQIATQILFVMNGFDHAMNGRCVFLHFDTNGRMFHLTQNIRLTLL